MYNDDVDIDNKDTRRGARGGKYLEKKTQRKTTTKKSNTAREKKREKEKKKRQQKCKKKRKEKETTTKKKGEGGGRVEADEGVSRVVPAVPGAERWLGNGSFSIS